MLRKCSSCRQIKPIDDYPNDKKGKDGKSYRCKACAAAASKAHYHQNREHGMAVRRAYHHANKARENLRSRQYRETHREEMREYLKAWRAANPNWNKERYARDKTRIIERQKGYYSKAREKKLAYAKEYREANKEAVSAIKLKCYLRKRRSDPGFRVLCNLRRRLTHALKGKNKSARTIELVGCTIPHLVLHLQSQFLPGMTWENYGTWHVDHIKPCALFDFTDAAQQRACFHWMNLQPLWGIDNILKSDA